MEASVIIIEGSDKGLVIPLTATVTNIGRDRTCEVSLSDLQSSRRHAQIVRAPGAFEIVDNESSNGTRVNGELVTRRPLQEGDIIVVGNTTLRFRVTGDAGKTDASPLSDTQTIAMDPDTAGAALRAEAAGMEELKRAKADLEVLYRVSRDVSSILETSQLLPRLIDILFEEIVKIDRCSVHMIDPRTGVLECKAQRIRRASPLPGEPYSTTLLNQVLRDKQALLTNDALTDARFRAGESIRISNICSAICVPLQTQKGLIGIVHVDTISPERRLNRDDLRVLAAVGVLAGAALENARLYEKIAYDKAALHVAHQDLKAAQGRLIQSEKLAAVGRMASGIVHDVKNPLTVILGYAGLIKSKLRKRDPGLTAQLGIVDDLNNIEKGIEYCTEVINGLLKFARPGEPSKSRTDLNELVRNTVAFVHVETQKAGVKIQTVPCDSLPAIMLDESQIKQVMINLILNAIQAMDKPERSIRISTELLVRGGAQWVRVAFRDNGKGMTDEERRRVFEPFYTTKEQGAGPGGTGLGLAVSFMIIEGHGGTIEVDSEAGIGTTFYLLLPVTG